LSHLSSYCYSARNEIRESVTTGSWPTTKLMCGAVSQVSTTKLMHRADNMRSSSARLIRVYAKQMVDRNNPVKKIKKWWHDVVYFTSSR
jgi:hypothetical protein